MWLERLNLIPLNEFEHIGGGGYGQIYKIKMKTELTELAVKIVQGVGKVDDYKSQVATLEKEYAIVSSLDNNSRNGQFFVYIRRRPQSSNNNSMEYLEGVRLQSCRQT